MVAATPLPGTAIDADKLAGEVHTLEVPRLAESRRTDVIANLAYGAFAQLDGLPPSFNLTDPRSYSPAEGRSFTLGARVRFD